MEPVQINAGNFMEWARALVAAGLAAEIEPPSTHSLHEQIKRLNPPDSEE